MKAVGSLLLLLSSLLAMLASSAEEGVVARTPALEILRAGVAPAVKGSVENFTGNVTIESRFQRDDPARIGGAIVSFQSGARTAWHTHPLGQTLIVTAGTGWVQREGSQKETIRSGDIVWIPPGVRHWHGATTQSAMTHIAIAEALRGNVVRWLEHVSDEEYRQARPDRLATEQLCCRLLR